MASILDVCNEALALLGVSDFIDDLEDETKEARLCNQFWAKARRSTLEASEWGFATRHTVLAAAVVGAPDDGLFSYLLPGDCIAPRCAYPSGSVRRRGKGAPYSIEDNGAGVRLLVTSLDGPLGLRYTADIETTGSWSEAFGSAVAARLAYLIAMALTGKPELRTMALSQWALELNAARAYERNIEEEDSEPQATHIAVRG